MYCAHQNINREKMTPDNIRWDTLSFADKYGGPILFIVFSLIAFICYFATA